MNRNHVRKKAILLRKKGLTYPEILRELGSKIAKSTLSYWFKTLKLSPEYYKRIQEINLNHLKRIRKQAKSANLKKRTEYLNNLINKNKKLLNKLNIDVQKIILSTLYLGEGAKYKSSRMLTLGSSDRRIIKFYLKLLKNCYNIDDDKFRVRIQCRFDQDKLKLEKFWQKITKIKKNKFYPTYVDQRTKGKPTLKIDYKGVCTIHYFNTEIQLELELLANEIIKKLIGPIV